MEELFLIEYLKPNGELEYYLTKEFKKILYLYQIFIPLIIIKNILRNIIKK